MNRFLSAALVALALTACGGTQAKAPAPSPAPAHPALWKVVDHDTTIYLFGTIHLLPKGLHWTTPAMATAMASSQLLYLEVALDKDPAKLGAVMAKLNNTPGLPPLLDRVPPAKRDLSYEDGAETQLTEIFAKAGKTVKGLETAEQQLGYFHTLPEAAQRTFLASVVDDDDAKSTKEFARMIAAWKAGDVRRIALTFDDEMKLSPVLADVLLHKRNANWAAWVGERMKMPGTVFVAVGAGHLAGKGSVEELVANRGFKVIRVQ